MTEKYVLHVKTNNSHNINGCKSSKQYSKNDKNMKEYDAEEDIIAEN